jgi:dihydroorotase
MVLTAPDDFHLHLRDGPLLRTVLPLTARYVQRAIVMPNLVPPVETLELAHEYRQRILNALPAGSPFEPLMTLYLTARTTPQVVRDAAAAGFVKAVKWYPAGATTHSDAGVKETDLERVIPTLTAMAEVGLPLLCHGETTDPSADIFDREALWVRDVLTPLAARLPTLKIVMEHITTAEGIDFVANARDGVAGTITCHHLLLNRNALFAYRGQGGLRPHHYCLPILKREQHRLRLLEAATCGSPKFFAGTDSAPHVQDRKEAACGCAGCVTSHAMLELYAEAFDSVGKLDKLEGFVSFFGADFYGLPRNTSKVQLEDTPWRVPDVYPVEGHSTGIVPFRAGENVSWTVSPV